MLCILILWKSAVFKFSLSEKPASTKSLQTDKAENFMQAGQSFQDQHNILQIGTGHTALSEHSFYSDTVGSRYVLLNKTTC